MHVAAVLVALPLLGAVIGYTTKWVSVWLLFNPHRWIGVGPIGWQGVVQRRSPKFAAGISDMLTTVVPVAELVGRVEPTELVDALMVGLEPRLKSLGPTVVDALQPGTWEAAAPAAQEMISAMIESEARSSLDELAGSTVVALADMDLQPLVVEALSGDNADRLADLVRTVAARELRTVIRYGALVGLFIGMVEAALFLAFERWWLLPLVGAIDGVVNNYMGIQMIFRPLEPRRYLGLFRYQGLMPARQADIARDYSRLLAGEVLGVPALVAHLGSARPELADDALESLRERLATPVLTMAPMLGVDADESAVQRVLTAILDLLDIDPQDPVSALADHPEVVDHLERTLDIADTLDSRLAALPKDEFESILRGIFTEDERTMLIIGGVIGGIIGCLQAAIAVAV